MELFNSNSSKKCSVEDDDVIIEFVRLHPMLYDVKNRDYRNPAVKNRLWIELGQQLNMHYLECNKRWKSLRDTYKRRNRRNPNSGSSYEHYNPKNDQLAFLDDNPLMERKSFTNISDDCSSNNDIFLENSSTTQFIEEVLFTDSANDVSPSLPSSDNENSTPKIPRKRKKTELDDLNVMLKESSQRLSNLTEMVLNKNNDKHAALYKFFNSLCDIVATFPQDKIVDVKWKLANLVAEEEKNNEKNKILNNPKLSQCQNAADAESSSEPTNST